MNRFGCFFWKEMEPKIRDRMDFGLWTKLDFGCIFRWNWGPK